MAGSLNHIVDDNGAFTMSNIENMGDAHEALMECFDLIALLADGRTTSELTKLFNKAKAPYPNIFPQFGVRADD